MFTSAPIPSTRRRTSARSEAVLNVPYIGPMMLTRGFSSFLRVLALTFFGPYSVHAVHDSATEGSAVINLRRRESRGDASLDRLVQVGVLSSGMAALLNACVVSRLNVLLCAGPGASVLPLMAGLLSCAPAIELQTVVVNQGADIGAVIEQLLARPFRAEKDV